MMTGLIIFVGFTVIVVVAMLLLYKILLGAIEAWQGKERN